MKKRNLILLLTAISMVFILFGCGTASKQQYPFMYENGGVSAEDRAIVIRPVEYAVNDLGPVSATAYEVRNKFPFSWFLGRHSDGDMPYEELAGANFISAVFAFGGDAKPKESLIDPLSKIAVHRAIKSMAGAEAIYVTNIEKSTQNSLFSEKLSIVVTGHALSYKSQGTMSEKRWDERKIPKIIR